MLGASTSPDARVSGARGASSGSHR